MKSILAYATLAVSTLGYSNAVMAQTDPNPALNTPDKLAWMLFIQVNTDAKTAGNNNSLFETWASDGETFTPNPVWPTTPSSMSLRPRALGHESKAAQLSPGTLVPQVVPAGSTGHSEETRRNRSTFDFIVKNRLFVVSGLKAAFAAGTPLSLQEDSIEVKVNWVEVGHLKGFNGFAGSAADAAKLYHVNKASDGKEYALVAMHVISKLVPNWTWATFEHKDNPGRCDVLGCRDAFGAQQTVVAPLSAIESQQHYGDCLKTPELRALMGKAKWDPAYVNYCLKGSQTDFTDATGLAVRVGNSVTENGFVAQASCMTCHSRANFDATGKSNGSFAGFDNTTGNASFGPVNPAWYWTLVAPDGNLAAPSVPLYQNIPVLQRVALPADFIWSIPFCAIDDTATPPKTKSSCAGK